MKSISGIVENPDMYGYLSGYDNLVIQARACGVDTARIDEVVARHESGALPRHEAFVELSVIARDFAGAASGKELSSSTLTDLAYLNRTPANRQGLDALKQTISALYPPEFADDARNRIAQTTSVQQAAEWVANLVERWRS